MSGKDPRDQANRKIYRAIGDFITQHALDPSPDNYALTHALVTDASSPVAKMILATTGDGLRLTQKDADRIRAAAGMESGGGVQAASSDAEVLARARESIDGIAAIIETARTHNQNYSRDLAHGADELKRAASDHPVVAVVAELTASMLDRARQAEEQLQATQDEADQLRRKLAEAEEQARSDPLTRLPNRRAFNDRLAELLAAGGMLSLAICDIDRFKSINDSHGHGVGDRVLRIVAETLQTNCNGHMVARIGGEEFAILFDGLDCAEAFAILDRARANLGARNFKLRENDAPLGSVTFSAGIARCAANDAEPALKRADTLLYAAKNGGRNKVLVEG